MAISNQQATWHILGAGAIGCLLAQQLKKEFLVSLVNRQRSCVKFIYYDHTNAPAESLTFDFIHQPINNLIICTKAFDAVAAFESIQALITVNTHVFCCFNGYGAQQLISDRHKKTFYCSNTFGAYLNNHELHFTGKGTIQVGPSNKTQPIPQTLPTLWQWKSTINEALLLKVAINSIINPLSVIYQCQNGHIVKKDQQQQQLMPRLAQEICLILQHLNVNIYSKQLIEHCLDIMLNTGDNFSSMLQDYNNNRRNEIDFINGYFIKEGKRLSLPYHINQHVSQQIQKMWRI